MEEMLNRLDINRAELEELKELPGLKPELAARIVEGRPYARVEDLRKVNGIGRVTLEKLRPLVMVAPPVEADVEQPGEPAAAPPVEEDMAEAPVEPAGEAGGTAEAEQGAGRPPEPPGAQAAATPAEEAQPVETGAADTREPEPAGVTKWLKLPAAGGKPLEPREAALYGLVGALVLLVLGTLLTLGILGAINRGLVYARPSQLAGVQQQVDELESAAGDLRSELAGLRARLDSLETISGRVGVLEEQTGSLRNDLQAASQKIAGFENRIDELNNRASALENRVGLFERFLSGLRDLMNQTLPQPAE